MVRLWSEEVGDAKSVIEPLVRELSPNVEVRFAPPRGVSKATAELILKKGEREARCIVTFEVWEQARKEPKELATAFRKIIDEMDSGAPLSAYLLTSRGLAKEPAEKKSELLHQIATGVEADVLADQFFKRGLRK